VQTKPKVTEEKVESIQQPIKRKGPVGRRRLLAEEKKRRICVAFFKDVIEKLNRSSRKHGRSLGCQVAYYAELGMTLEEYVSKNGLPIPLDGFMQGFNSEVR